MKKIPSFWFIGIAIALVGIVIARMVAPMFENEHSVAIVVKTFGHFMAFGGVFFIARGISKSSAQDE